VGLEFTTKVTQSSQCPTIMRRRLQDLGHGSTFTRKDAARLCGSLRAGDLFLYRAQEHGWVVHDAWGMYLVPTEERLSLLTRMSDPRWARLVALHWSGVRIQGVPGPATFAGPLLWDRIVETRGRAMPVFALDSRASKWPRIQPYLEAFLLDPLGGVAQESAVVAGTERIAFLAPPITDVVRILVSSMNRKWIIVAQDLLEEAAAESRQAFDATRKAWRYPESPPSPSRASRYALPPGPPASYRLFAPKWYMTVMKDATSPQYRRTVMDA
jgi:hypothetical protein